VRPPRKVKQSLANCERLVECRTRKRIFVAFTRGDFDAALAIKKSLEQGGLVVFVFLKGKNEAPWADPALVGEVFAQANHRLVIDTGSARGSEGVRFEGLYCEPLLMPPVQTVEMVRDLDALT
jgi:hypothetical protein